MGYVCLNGDFWFLNMFKDLALLVFFSIWIGYIYGKKDAKKRTREERKVTRRRRKKDEHNA